MLRRIAEAGRQEVTRRNIPGKLILVFAEIAKRFLAFYGTRRFITMGRTILTPS
jgi:hypothetical protein